MPTGQNLLAAILADPDDDTVRLAYADWLEEQGDPAQQPRAEFIRVQVELAQGEPFWPGSPWWGWAMDVARAMAGYSSPDPHRRQLAERERLLLEEHRDLLLGKLPGWLSRTSLLRFHRGFVA